MTHEHIKPSRFWLKVFVESDIQWRGGLIAETQEWLLRINKVESFLAFILSAN